MNGPRHRLDPALVRAAVASVFADLSSWDRLRAKAGDPRHGPLRDQVEQAFLQRWISYCDLAGHTTGDQQPNLM